LKSGGYLLVDGQNFRLLEYDGRGALVRAIGRQGNGPGQFQDIGPIALAGDSVLYVLGTLTLHVFDFRTGTFRSKASLAAPFATSIAAAGANLYFRSLDSAQAPRISAWRDSAVVQGPSLPSLSELEAVNRAGAVATARLMNATHAGAVFAPIGGDTVAVLSQASDQVVLTNLQDILGRIPIARTQRQGVRPDLIAQIATDPNVAQRDPQILYTPSVPTALARTRAGHYVTVTTDFTFVNNRFSAKLFLSVIDPQSGLTCPDARVPAPEDPRPAVALRGDTLLVLSQTLQGTTAMTVLRKYQVQTTDCKWTRTGAA
jgi:hypothetical protein